MRELMRHIGNQPFASRFYLAGGTALALRLGHRRSIDLDFFSNTDPVDPLSRREIVTAFVPLGARTIEDVDGNLLLQLPELDVAFLSYGYPLLDPLDEVVGIHLASIVDVGLMKLDALITRGSRKDFYDLYFVSQHIPIARLLHLARSKYPYAKDFDLMAIESMVLFDNAERDHQPDLLTVAPWDLVRAFFVAQAKLLGETWLTDD